MRIDMERGEMTAPFLEAADDFIADFAITNSLGQINDTERHGQQCVAYTFECGVTVRVRQLGSGQLVHQVFKEGLPK